MTDQKVSKTVLLQPQGQLDLEGGVELQHQIAAIASERYSCWVLDLAKIEFINSSGLVALISGLNIANECKCRLVLCNLPAHVKLIFEITQLDQVFEIVETPEALFAELPPVMELVAPKTTVSKKSGPVAA
ncbi:MAG TPA: STAS domain-containing protein [Allocoleopsis sp.]